MTGIDSIGRDGLTSMTDSWDEPTISRPVQAADGPDIAPERGSIVNGRYRLIETIGSGGMSTVYLGHDERLGRDVAIKIITSSPVSPAPLREERVISTLHHANIVSVFDAGEIPDGESDAGSTFIVMEYVRGSTAHAVAPVPWQRAADIVRQAAFGLSAAHERGIVHCDVKPGNLLIDTTGRVLVADFGVATEAQSEAGSYVHGSPAYIAPERLRGAPAHPNMDVYGLGGVLVYLLTGRKPEQQVTPVVPPDCPDALLAVINRARSVEPDDRFPDARAFAAAIDEAVGTLDVDRSTPVASVSDVHRSPRYAAQPAASSRRVRHVAPPPDARIVRPYRDGEPPVTLLGRPRQPVQHGAPSRTLVAAIVLAIVVAVAGAFVLQDIVSLGGTTTVAAAVEMPDLRDQTFGSAIEALADEGITVDRVDVVYGPGPLNQIVAQQPAAGTQVSDADNVVLVVRTGR
jgi:serine/threonine-protein kinase